MCAAAAATRRVTCTMMKWTSVHDASNWMLNRHSSTRTPRTNAGGEASRMTDRKCGNSHCDSEFVWGASLTILESETRIVKILETRDVNRRLELSIYLESSYQNISSCQYLRLSTRQHTHDQMLS